MVHKIAKLILEHTSSFIERAEAVEVAMSLGMKLDEIQDYLDWIDSLPDRTPGRSSPSDAGQVQEENIALPEQRLPIKNGEGNPK